MEPPAVSQQGGWQEYIHKEGSCLSLVNIGYETSTCLVPSAICAQADLVKDFLLHPVNSGVMLQSMYDDVLGLRRQHTAVEPQTVIR